MINYTDVFACVKHAESLQRHLHWCVRLEGMPSRTYYHALNKEMEMPKMKTKSGAKKRFKVTASGRIKAGQAGKRHGMIKRSNKFLRNARGTTVLCKADEGIVKKYMPYAR